MHVMDTMQQTSMKLSVTNQVGDHIDVDKAIVEAEVLEEDVADIGAEVLDKKRHQ